MKDKTSCSFAMLVICSYLAAISGCKPVEQPIRLFESAKWEMTPTPEGHEPIFIGPKSGGWWVDRYSAEGKLRYTDYENCSSCHRGRFVTVGREYEQGRFKIDLIETD